MVDGRRYSADWALLARWHWLKASRMAGKECCPLPPLDQLQICPSPWARPSTLTQHDDGHFARRAFLALQLKQAAAAATASGLCNRERVETKSLP